MSDKEKKSDKEGWRKNLLSGLSGGASKREEKVNIINISQAAYLKMSFKFYGRMG